MQIEKPKSQPKNITLKPQDQDEVRGKVVPSSEINLNESLEKLKIDNTSAGEKGGQRLQRTKQLRESTNEQMLTVAAAAERLHIRLVEKWEWSNDEVFKVLSSLNPQERKLLREFYQIKYKNSLDSDAEKDLGKGEELERFKTFFSESLNVKANPENRTEFLKSLEIANKVSPNISNQEALNQATAIYQALRKNTLLVDLTEIQQCSDKIHSLVTATTIKDKSAKASTEVISLLKRIQYSAKIRKEENDQLTDTLAATSSCLVVTGIAFAGAAFTGGQSLWLLGALSATGSFVSTVSIKSFLKGESYELFGQEMKKDLAFSAIEGVMLPAGGALSVGFVGRLLAQNGYLTQGIKLSSKTVFETLSKAPLKYHLLQNLVEAGSGEFLTGFSQQGAAEYYFFWSKEKTATEAFANMTSAGANRALTASVFTLGLNSFLGLGSFLKSRKPQLLIPQINTSTSSLGTTVELSLRKANEAYRVDGILKKLGFADGLTVLPKVSLENLRFALLSKISELSTPKSAFFGFFQNESSKLLNGYNFLLRNLKFAHSSEITENCRLLGLSEIGNFSTHHPTNIYRRAQEKIKEVVKNNRGNKTLVLEGTAKINEAAAFLVQRVLLPHSTRTGISFGLGTKSCWTFSNIKQRELTTANYQTVKENYEQACKILNFWPNSKNILPNLNDRMKNEVIKREAQIEKLFQAFNGHLPLEIGKLQKEIQSLISARNYLLAITQHQQTNLQYGFGRKVKELIIFVARPLTQTVNLSLHYIKYVVWAIPPGTFNFLKSTGRIAEKYFPPILPIRTFLQKYIFNLIPPIIRWSKLQVRDFVFGDKTRNFYQLKSRINKREESLPVLPPWSECADFDPVIKNVFNVPRILEKNSLFGISPYYRDRFVDYGQYFLRSAVWLLVVPFIANKTKEEFKRIKTRDYREILKELENDFRSGNWRLDFERYLVSFDWSKRITKRFAFLGDRIERNARNIAFQRKGVELVEKKLRGEFANKQEEKQKMAEIEAFNLFIVYENLEKLYQFVSGDNSSLQDDGKIDYLKKYVLWEPRTAEFYERIISEKFPDLKKEFEKLLENQGVANNDGFSKLEKRENELTRFEGKVEKKIDKTNKKEVGTLLPKPIPPPKTVN